MAMIFEDAFMDAQSSAVSLCIEFLEMAQAIVDKVYIYMYIEEQSFLFNAFFEKDSRLFLPEDVSNTQDTLNFLNLGADDAMNILNVCKKFNKNCPREIKMIFYTKSHKFESEYRYELLTEEEVGPSFRFIEWQETIEKDLGK